MNKVRRIIFQSIMMEQILQIDTLKEPQEQVKRTQKTLKEPTEPQEQVKRTQKEPRRATEQTNKNFWNSLKSHKNKTGAHNKTHKKKEQEQEAPWLILHHQDREWRGETMILSPQEDLPTQDSMGKENHSTTRTRTSMDNRRTPTATQVQPP
jgi:hypothetical protein